jgi:hypothetical protein
MNQHELVKQAIEKLADYTAIQNKPMKWAGEDELHWKEYELPKLAAILDELHIQTDPQFAEDIENQEGQQQLNHEYERVMNL